MIRLFDSFMILHNNVLRNQTVLLDKKPELFVDKLDQQENSKIDENKKNDSAEETEVIKDQSQDDSSAKKELKE